jgi:glutathione peroxidase
MKTFILTFVMFLTGISIFGQSSFYDFTVKDINGNNFSFSSLKGKKVMVVNTASKCGFTPQYADLENLYKNYNSQNFVIIGFPANNFLNQEPGSDKEIQDYCKKNYGVTFPMMSKISVKGKDMAPLYKWLTSKSLNGVEDSEVKWNFQKYLVDENGKLFAVIYTKDKPDSPEVLDWLTKK